MPGSPSPQREHVLNYTPACCQGPYSRTRYDTEASDWSRWPSRPIRSLRYIETCHISSHWYRLLGHHNIVMIFAPYRSSHRNAAFMMVILKMISKTLILETSE